VARISGYLEKRRQSWEAVIDVPLALRDAVGRKRLRKGLGTRDKDVAKARLPRALLELHTRIDGAARSHPESDSVTAEAIAFREAFGQAQRAPQGPVAYAFEDDRDGTRVEITEGERAVEALSNAIAMRAEVLERVEGLERAQSFADLAFGRSTPLLHHMETWLAEPGTRGRPVRERTKMEYRGMVTAFRDWLAQERVASTVEAITRRAAGRYVSAMHAKGLSASRIRDITSALSTYWKWMERRGEAAEGSNPWPRQAPPKSADGGRETAARSFTDEELVNLLTGTQDRVMLDVMCLLALSGMRIDEACRLRVGNCQGGNFAVPGTKTAAADRMVPIHPFLVGIVERRCAGRQASEWLIHELGEPDRYGRRSPTLDARLNRYRVEQGVDDRPEGSRRSRVNIHSFRRWFITEALRAGQPDRVVKQVVGHALPKSDVTLGVYFGGDLPAAWRACVEAVRLPSSISDVCPA
jgi:integrase